MIQCGSIQFEERAFFFIRLAVIVDVLLAPCLDGYLKEGLSLRINVMKARKPLKYLFLCHRLDAIYHYGFEPKHRDTHLSFLVCKWFNFAQGNCGEAFLTEEPQLADLTEGVPYEYRLSENKIRKTDYIKGIISIPVFELMSENTTPKVVGVINIDTNDEDLIRDWVDDEECLKSIIDAFENHAKIVSHFI